MLVGSFETTTSYGVNARIERYGDGVFAAYDTNNFGGGPTIFTVLDGVKTAVVTGGVASGNYQDIEVLADGAFVLFRSGFFGDFRLRVIEADGTARTADIDAANDGSPPTANVAYAIVTPLADGTFFAGIADNTYATETVTLTFPPRGDFNITSQTAGRGLDIGYRFFEDDGTGGSFETTNQGSFSNGGTSGPNTFGEQALGDALALTSGAVVQVYRDIAYFDNVPKSQGGPGGATSENVITVRLVTEAGVSGPIRVNTEPLTIGGQEGITSRGGQQLVSLGADGFAVIWHEQLYEERPVNGGTGFFAAGLETRIRYFDIDGAPLTGEVLLFTRGEALGNIPANVGVDSLGDGRIALVFQDGIGGFNGTTAGRLFVSVAGELGSTIDTSAITPPLQEGRAYSAWDLVSLEDGEIAVSYSGPNSTTGVGGNFVETFQVGDLIQGDGLANTLTSGDGTDRLEGLAGNDTLLGAGGDDGLQGGTGDDLLDGGDGFDTADYSDAAGSIRVNLGAATAQNVGAGLGSDRLVSIENAVGGAGIDVITGSAAANMLSGGAGNDTLYGLGDNDTLFGEAGSDRLDGGAGLDTMFGGSGNDIYVVDATGDVADEDAVPTIDDGGVDLVQASATFTLGAFLERLTLTGAGAIDGTGNGEANQLRGNNAANVLNGMGGNDILIGNGGVDTLNGGAGADDLSGGLGADRLDGGEDADIYRPDLTDLISDTGTLGRDRVISNGTYVLAAGNGVEDLLTGVGVVGGNLVGNELGNAITGNTGANIIRGLAGADTLRGGAGNDTLEGGTGRDTLFGEDGADVFRFASGDSPSTVSPIAYDTIQDFATGVDDIDLTVITGGGPTAGQYAEVALATNVFANLKAAAEAELAAGARVVFVAGSSNGWLFWSIDAGSGTAEEAVLLAGRNTLASFAAGDLI